MQCAGMRDLHLQSTRMFSGIVHTQYYTKIKKIKNMIKKKLLKKYNIKKPVQVLSEKCALKIVYIITTRR